MNRSNMRFDSFEVQRMTRTPEGFLDIWGVSAHVGILQYEDGSEYVGDNTLQDSVTSLRGAPVTLEHPAQGFVTPENVKDLAVGFVVDASYDAETGQQRVHLRVADAEAIASVLTRKTVELSPGYEVLAFGPGKEGADREQLGRQVNHLALTEAGRGGSEASLRLDNQASHTEEVGMEEDENGMSREDMMSKLDEMSKKMDAMLTERADMQSKMDAMQAKLDMYEKKDMSKEDEEDEDMSKMDSKQLNQLVRDHAEALDIASRMGVDVTEEDSTDNVRRKIVKQALGEQFRADSSEDYILSAYDFVRGQVPKQNTAGHVLGALNGQRMDSIGGLDDVVDPEEWRKNLSPKHRNRSRNGGK